MSAATEANEPSPDVETPPGVRPGPSVSPLSRGERLTVALLSLVQAAVFGWAYVLPWDKVTVFGALCSIQSASHLVLAVVLLAPTSARVRLRAWGLTSGLSVLVFAWGTWAVFSSSWYLSQLYGGLGQGLAAALIAIWALLLLVTVPMAAWGLTRSKGHPFRLPLKTTFLVLVLAHLLGAASPQRGDNGAVARDDDATSHEWGTLVRTHIAPRLASLARVPEATLEWSPIAAKRPTSCDEAVDESATAIVFFRDRAAKLTSRCFQAATLPELAVKVSAGLDEFALADLVVVDRITSQRVVRSRSPLLDPLLLRPGLDGGCIGRKCLAPWQLIAQGSFTTHAPLSFLGDLKFGLSLATLRKQLAPTAESDEPLLGISTQSASISADGTVVDLKRQHPVEVPLTRPTVERAAHRYASHIVAAQQANGQFRYTLDPFSGQADVKNFSIPRQAGTLLVLCELGEDTPEVAQAIRLGLQLLTTHSRKRGEHWALAMDKRAKLVRLGDSALPLVAFTACRPRVGSEFDDAIKGLSQFILHQQRPDGSFTSTYDWKQERQRGGTEALYAPGQALLGLTLLDSIVLAARDSAPNDAALGDHDALTRAIQRGMDHVAHEHWNIAMYPFFFVEENWNCLTARAALPHQRNDDYERFCIDYMRFKSRLVFEHDSAVASEFLGGFGFGNVIPPHNTGAAGLGEALSALLSVKKARGEDTSHDEARLRLLLQFLLRQQWTPETCFACAPHVVGSMSEHLHSPITRIDFTQHAWAAVGHGSRVLGMTGP